MDEVDTAFLTLIAQQEMPAASNHRARRQRQRQSQAAIFQRLLSMFLWLHVYTWYIMCRLPTPHTAAVTKKRAPGALPWCQPYFDTTMVLRALALSHSVLRDAQKGRLWWIFPIPSTGVKTHTVYRFLSNRPSDGHFHSNFLIHRRVLPPSWRIQAVYYCQVRTLLKKASPCSAALKI